MSLAFAITLSLAAQAKPEPPIVAAPVPAPPAVLVPTPPPISYSPPAPPPPPPPPRPEDVHTPPRPLMPLIYYFSQDDYPAAALRNGEEGTTRFRLTVGENGRVTDCVILSSSGSSALDSATCRILRSRARFAPATDVRGRAVASLVVSRTRWSLPEEPSAVTPDIELLADATAALSGPSLHQPRPLDPLPDLFTAADYPAEALAAETLADTDLHLVVGADGLVSSCAVAASSGLAALDEAACRVLTERALFAPAHRAGAGPVDSILVTRIHWREPPEEVSDEEEAQAQSR